MPDLAKTEKETFDVATLPYGIILAAKKADGDVNSFCDEIDFEFPDTILTKVQARQVLSYIATEEALDVVAGTPNSPEALERLVDDSMYREIKRLNKEVRCLTKIADMHPDKDVKIKHTGEIINAVMAKSRLVLCMSQMKEYSKLISEQTKAKNTGGGDGPGVSLNMQFNMSDMVSEGLERLGKTLDIPVEVSQ